MFGAHGDTQVPIASCNASDQVPEGAHQPLVPIWLLEHVARYLLRLETAGSELTGAQFMENVASDIYDVTARYFKVLA